jgi:hypothetical protein
MPVQIRKRREYPFSFLLGGVGGGDGARTGQGVD